MIILEDSREQKPLVFKIGTRVSRETVKVGDYGVRLKDGVVPPIFFERKSLSDLFSSMTRNAVAHKKKLIRANELEQTIILICEASLTEIKGTILYRGRKVTYRRINALSPIEKRKVVHGSTVIKAAMTFSCKYNSPFVLCNSRDEMSTYILSYFEALSRAYKV